jgi:hypothetical protein
MVNSAYTVFGGCSIGLATVLADFVEELELFLETGLGCTPCPAHSAGSARRAPVRIRSDPLILHLAKFYSGRTLRPS